jgi:hypothetical protein
VLLYDSLIAERQFPPVLVKCFNSFRIYKAEMYFRILCTKSCPLNFFAIKNMSKFVRSDKIKCTNRGPIVNLRCTLCHSGPYLSFVYFSNSGNTHLFIPVLIQEHVSAC